MKEIIDLNQSQLLISTTKNNYSWSICCWVLVNVEVDNAILGFGGTRTKSPSTNWVSPSMLFNVSHTIFDSVRKPWSVTSWYSLPLKNNQINNNSSSKSIKNMSIYLVLVKCYEMIITKKNAYLVFFDMMYQLWKAIIGELRRGYTQKVFSNIS